MNKFAQITVFELFNGKTPETIESDKDYRTGTYLGVVLGKTQIRWDDTMQIELVNSDMLHKYDKTQYVLTRPDETDNLHASVEAIETALSGNLDKALEMTKPQYERQIPPMAHVDQNGVSTDIQPPKARKPRTAAKHGETDK